MTVSRRERGGPMFLTPGFADVRRDQVRFRHDRALVMPSFFVRSNRGRRSSAAKVITAMGPRLSKEQSRLHLDPMLGVRPCLHRRRLQPRHEGREQGKRSHHRLGLGEFDTQGKQIDAQHVA